MNQTLSDDNLEGGVLLHNTIENVHPLNNHENVVEQLKGDLRAPMQCQTGWPSW